MIQRKFVSATILASWAALVLPLSARAAPGDTSAKSAAPATPAAKSKGAASAGAPPAPSAKPTLAASPNAMTPAAVRPSTAPAVPTPLKAELKLPPPKTPIEAALQGVVMLQRAGAPLSLGTLLNGDGRILTALSPLTHGNLVDARYPDGRLVRVKLSYSDRAWDLALLTPEVDAPHAGLKASHDASPAAGSKLHAVSHVRDQALGATDLTIKAKSTLRGGDSAELADALELAFNPKPSDIGAPLLNDKGEVVAIVARACSPSDKTSCTLTAYGAPVSAIRGFLRGVPVRRGPWLGLEAVAFDAGIARGVRVAAVAPEGPAANAGLRAGPPGMADVVLAVDGTPVRSAEELTDALENHTPGAPIRLLVLSEGRYREVAVVLLESPEAVGRRERVMQTNPWPHPPSGPAQPRTEPNPYR